jgi:hypothetical protein
MHINRKSQESSAPDGQPGLACRRADSCAGRNLPASHAGKAACYVCCLNAGRFSKSFDLGISIYPFSSRLAGRPTCGMASIEKGAIPYRSLIKIHKPIEFIISASLSILLEAR